MTKALPRHRHRIWPAIILAVSFMVLTVGQAFCITCEECQERTKKKTTLEKALSDERIKLRKAQDEKNLQEVVTINKRITDLNRDINLVYKEIDLTRRECEAACKPDVVQRMQCRKIMEEIEELESQASAQEDAAIAKVDDLYRKLQHCRKKLKELER